MRSRPVRPLLSTVVLAAAVLPGCVFDDVREINEQLAATNAELVKVKSQLALLDDVQAKLSTIDTSLASVDTKLDTLDASITGVNANLASLRGTINNIDSAIPFLSISGDKDDDAATEGDDAGAPSTPDGRTPAEVAADAATKAAEQGEPAPDEPTPDEPAETP